MSAKILPFRKSMRSVTPMTYPILPLSIQDTDFIFTGGLSPQCLLEIGADALLYSKMLWLATAYALTLHVHLTSHLFYVLSVPITAKKKPPQLSLCCTMTATP